jgi:trigger factor
VPEIELPDLADIKIVAPSTDVSEQDVDAIIDGIRTERATLEPVAAKAAELGDVIKMNIRGRLGGEEVLNEEDFDFEVVEEAPGEPVRPLPGLSAELMGAKPADIREITLPLGDDYPDPNMAGKTLLLNIVVKAIQRKVLPELNDEFVQQVSSTSKTVADLRETIRHNLEHERFEEAFKSVANEATDSLIARVNPPAPDGLVQDELDRIIREQRRRLERSGLQFDQFLLATNMSEDAFRESIAPTAERAVKRDLLLDAYAKAENIEPDPRAVDAEVRIMSGAVSGSERDYEVLSGSRRLHDLVTEEMRRRVALTKLVEIVSGLKPLEHDHDHDHESVEDEAVAHSEEKDTETAVAGS